MTDIVERLRRRSLYLEGSSAERTMDEAAVEIERLTAALYRITGCSFGDEAISIARRALEQKP